MADEITIRPKSESASSTEVIRFSTKYRMLRILFISGFVLQAILFFVPSVRMKSPAFVVANANEQNYSLVHLARVASQNGKTGGSSLIMLVFCIYAAFALLAVKFPRRWVFIVGSCYVLFWLISDVFHGETPRVQYLFLPHLLSYVATALSLSGFWVKPFPGNNVTPLLA